MRLYIISLYLCVLSASAHVDVNLLGTQNRHDKTANEGIKSETTYFFRKCVIFLRPEYFAVIMVLSMTMHVSV